MPGTGEGQRLPSASHWVRLGEVDVFRWLPARRAVTATHQPVNFGDQLALEIVRGMLRDRGRTPLEGDAGDGPPAARLLSVGSVLHFAEPGDVVWGAGINGKLRRPLGTTTIDVRSVRGPLTRAVLAEAGLDAPPVFGDPALLTPLLLPHLAGQREVTRPLSVIPNLNDLAALHGQRWLVQPTEPFAHVIGAILQSELVVASSLHGIVLAEAFGVPVRPLRSAAEHGFKYDDYAAGTGRAPFRFAATVEQALELGPMAPLDWDPSALVQAFPHDLWSGDRDRVLLGAGSGAAPYTR
ncbi:polysaccharide pyruvyl transferase family protein [Agrococcus baldri]|uniref:GumL protein n=1 Tax=Agrococcus baldri TaxID=153730 RepID=A0AA87USU8_9MICO|nr:polysaccharide pyruvyl transferase family protein [Agrococcus baldri]GEK80760.1 GumL protein [Agrococcus baldri]